MHRWDLGLYSHLRDFLGMESEPVLTPREKSPLLDGSEQGQTHCTAPHRSFNNLNIVKVFLNKLR